MSVKTYSKTVYVLFKKELLAYFSSPIAYIFLAVFLLAGNWLFFSNFFLAGQASMRIYFVFLPWVFLFLAPAITMRLWAEEKKMGTNEFLMTLPVTDWQLVLSKFLSALFFVLIALVLTLTLPLTVNLMGDLDLGPIWGGYIGALFLAGAYLALGLFISSLTKNQIVAFVLALGAGLVFFIIGSETVLNQAPAFAIPVMKFLGLGSHFESISKGVIDSKNIVYYLSFIFFFLWLNVKVLEKRELS